MVTACHSVGSCFMGVQTVVKLQWAESGIPPRRGGASCLSGSSVLVTIRDFHVGDDVSFFSDADSNFS